MAVKPHHKTELLKIIHKYLPNCKVWLFGSRARDQERAGSDIDLALDNGEKIPWGIITKMLIDIDETTLPMSIDLVDLYTVDEDFKKRALSEGILWTV
jgi:predicted nucleotidyltransferase